MSKAQQDGAMHDISDSNTNHEKGLKPTNTNKPKMASKVIAPDDGFMNIKRKGSQHSDRSGSIKKN